MSPTVLPLSTGNAATEASATRPLGFRLIPARSTCTALSICSPPTFEAFAKNDGRRVHDDQEGQEHDDRARGLFDEAAFRAVRPQEHLHGQRGGRIREALR